MLHDAGDQRITIFPITMLGPAKAGKTALVSSFVQNFFPTVYVPSTSAELFYKTVDIVEVKCPKGHAIAEDAAGEKDKRCIGCEGKVDEGKIFRCQNEHSCGCVCRSCWTRLREDQSYPAMIEIEDTYAWGKSDGCDKWGNDYDAEQFLAPSADLSEEDIMPAKMSTRHVGEEGDASARGESTPKAAGSMMGSMLGGLGLIKKDPRDSFIMLSNFNAPVATEYIPLTNGRLGFMIVFDCHDTKSWQEAQAIHQKLVETKTQQGTEMEPVVFLVASQVDRIDKDGGKIREEAHKYTKHWQKAHTVGDASRLFYEEVSATEFRKVKRLFRSMLVKMRDIHDAQQRKDAEAESKKGGWNHAFGGWGGDKTPKGDADSSAADDNTARKEEKKDCALQ